MSRKATKDAIDRRRQLVAQMRLRGLTVREIVAALIEARQANPTTGAPWSVGTVQSDLTALSEQWRTDAKQDTAELKGKTYGRLEEIIREAFREKDLSRALDAIKQERDLFGLDAPKRNLIGGDPDADPIRVADESILSGIDINALSDEELQALEASVALIERLRAAGSGTGEAPTQ